MTSKTKLSINTLYTKYLVSEVLEKREGEHGEVSKILTEFIEFFITRKQKVKTLEDITSHDSKDYYEYLVKKYKDQKVINKHVCEMSRFIFYADDKELLDINKRWNEESKVNNSEE